MLVTHDFLPSFRAHLPGFREIEERLLAAIVAEGVCQEGYHPCTDEAHFLAQSHANADSSGFQAHHDTQQKQHISLTAVVQLNDTPAALAPSSMRVIGATDNFEYGREAGSAGLFFSNLCAHMAPAMVFVSVRACVRPLMVGCQSH